MASEERFRINPTSTSEADGLIASTVAHTPFRATMQCDLAGRVTYVTIEHGWIASEGVKVTACDPPHAIERALARWTSLRAAWPELAPEADVSEMLARMHLRLREVAEEISILRRSRGAA